MRILPAKLTLIFHLADLISGWGRSKDMFVFISSLFLVSFVLSCMNPSQYEDNSYFQRQWSKTKKIYNHKLMCRYVRMWERVCAWVYVFCPLTVLIRVSLSPIRIFWASNLIIFLDWIQYIFTAQLKEVKFTIERTFSHRHPSEGPRQWSSGFS